MEVFTTAGLPLFKSSTWPTRAEDDKWKLGMLGALAHYKVEAEHVAALMSNMGSVRFRCEEVAAGVSSPRVRQEFEEINETSKKMAEDTKVFQSVNAQAQRQQKHPGMTPSAPPLGGHAAAPAMTEDKS
jgi:hypothetical protein